ncbi:Pimeloyl-ACP methyl ester carboxylesterase [Sphingomonas gellani]|uniref:Pimeloyl-ACP methyl ester carboxylesterase n=2 Tax=Sphingomonas gellani TaxID=1166340 RepID=A0A1H7ZGU7_9SPHN|nr:Pimeloyl-ACP methyl ester carboxylesterase [Sphingomonas gellani]
MGLAAAGTLLGSLALYSASRGVRARREVPRDGRMMVIDGTPLHVVDRSQGPAIVMIHGLGGQLRNFNYGVADRLAERHRVILIDRPGAGYSSVMSDGRTGIVAQADLIARLIEVMELDRPLLVGHSLGAAIALALAERWPHLVRGLALIAPLTQPLTTLPRATETLAALPRSLRLALAAMVAVPLGRLAGERTMASAFAPEPVAPDFMTRGGGMLSMQPGVLASALTDIGRAQGEMAEIAAGFPTMSLPAHILFAREDRVLEPDLHGARTAAALPNGRLEMVEGGHMLPITQPDLTARFIEGAWRESASPIS